MKGIFALLIMTLLHLTSFKDTQLQYPRVRVAYEEKEGVVKQYFQKKNLHQEGFNLFLRAFKKEKSLEVWVKEKGEINYTILVTYDFCMTSGILGPKRREGDLQIPEGIYHINQFNPYSNFHLSLGINYPNASDKILSDKQKPGGEIYIHGDCVTIGCIPITDDKIKELYILAVEARNNGQEKIPVHIFPCRMNEEGMNFLENKFSDPKVISFWKNLKGVYDDFEQTAQTSRTTIDRQGRYVLVK